MPPSVRILSYLSLAISNQQTAAEHQETNNKNFSLKPWWLKYLSVGNTERRYVWVQALWSYQASYLLRVDVEDFSRCRAGDRDESAGVHLAAADALLPDQRHSLPQPVNAVRNETEVVLTDGLLISNESAVRRADKLQVTTAKETVSCIKNTKYTDRQPLYQTEKWYRLSGHHRRRWLGWASGNTHTWIMKAATLKAQPHRRKLMHIHRLLRWATSGGYIDTN